MKDIAESQVLAGVELLSNSILLYYAPISAWIAISIILGHQARMHTWAAFCCHSALLLCLGRYTGSMLLSMRLSWPLPPIIERGKFISLEFCWLNTLSLGGKERLK
jgi:hypothetical protein